jgi:hypothetical protein
MRVRRAAIRRFRMGATRSTGIILPLNRQPTARNNAPSEPPACRCLEAPGRHRVHRRYLGRSPSWGTPHRYGTHRFRPYNVSLPRDPGPDLSCTFPCGRRKAAPLVPTDPWGELALGKSGGGRRGDRDYAPAVSRRPRSPLHRVTDPVRPVACLRLRGRV